MEENKYVETPKESTQCTVPVSDQLSLKGISRCPLNVFRKSGSVRRVL
jgi:hypothetical protein